MPDRSAPSRAGTLLLAAVLVASALACLAVGALLTLPAPGHQRAARAYAARPLDDARTLAAADEGQRVWLRGTLEAYGPDAHRPVVAAARGMAVYEQGMQLCRASRRRAEDGGHADACSWQPTRAHAGPVGLRSGGAAVLLAWRPGWRVGGDGGWSAPEGERSGARRARGFAEGAEVLVAGVKQGRAVAVEHVTAQAPADYVSWRRRQGLPAGLTGLAMLTVGWLALAWAARLLRELRGRRVRPASPAAVALVEVPLTAAGMAALAWSAMPVVTVTATDFDAVLALAGAAAVLGGRRAAREAEAWARRAMAEPPPSHRPRMPVVARLPWEPAGPTPHRRPARPRPSGLSR